MKGKKGITRREFMKTTGAAGAALALAPSLAGNVFAAERDHILIGHPNPSTGPLAGFGEASPWADNRAIAAINKDGGLFIKEYGKKVPVRLKMVDTESDPTKAAELTSRLILSDKVDLMVVMHTPDTVNPVTAMCERYQMPCIALDAPVDAWLTGGPYKWSHHAFWTVTTMANLFVDMWDEAKDKIEDAVEKLGDNAEKVWDKVEDKAEALWEKAQSGELTEEAKAKLGDLAEGAKGLWNKLVDKIDGDDAPATDPEKQA